jgi:transposase InsO family protein
VTSLSPAYLISLRNKIKELGEEMSSLKYQLRSLISSLSAEANRIKDPEIKKRLYLIKAVSESKKSVLLVCESRGVSTDFFYKWARRFIKAESLLGLMSQSRTAKTFWNKTLKRVEKRIIKLRRAEPFKGPDRISFDLKKKFNIVCSPSTVAAVLKRAGLVTKQYRDRLTKKHMKRYRRPWPGYLQMDFKYVPYLIEGRQVYQLSAIDHHSSWRFIRSYPYRKLETVIKFLDELESVVPFEIIQIQTDNATEFTDKFSSFERGRRPTYTHEVDVWCMQRGIEHRLIPIGEKEINGKVENTHKWDDREFFSQIEVHTIDELQVETKDWNRRWNEERATKTLGWLTPNETLVQACVRSIAYLQLSLKKAADEVPKRVRTVTIGRSKVTATSKELKQLKTPKKKTKRPTDVDRYLQYLDWEERQKLKSWIPLPLILKNFSSKLIGHPLHRF